MRKFGTSTGTRSGFSKEGELMKKDAGVIQRETGESVREREETCRKRERESAYGSTHIHVYAQAKSSSEQIKRGQDQALSGLNENANLHLCTHTNG